MLDRSAFGALGAIAAALALAALAGMPRSAPATRPLPQPASVPAASAHSVRALRDGQRLDLNQAGAADLELLPGIGPSLARRIVEDRAARGPFQNVEALQRVRGIGPRTLQRLRALIEVVQAQAP